MRTTKVFWFATVACLGIPLVFFALLLNRELLSGFWALAVHGDDQDSVTFVRPEWTQYSREEVAVVLRVLREGDPEDRETALRRLTSISKREHPWLKDSILDFLRETLASEGHDPAHVMEGATWVLGPEALQEFRELASAADGEGRPGPSWSVWVQDRVWRLRQWTRSHQEIDRKRESRVDLFHRCPSEEMHRVMDCVLRSTDLPVEDYPGPSEFTDGEPFEFHVEGRADSGRSIFRHMLNRKQWGPILDALQRDRDPGHQEVLWDELSRWAPPGRNWPLESFHAVALATLTTDDEVPERTRFLAADWIARTTYGLDQRPAIDLEAMADLAWERWNAEDPERVCRVRRFLTRMLPADVSRVIHTPHSPQNLDCSAWTPDGIAEFRALLRSGAFRFDPDEGRYAHDGLATAGE